MADKAAWKAGYRNLKAKKELEEFEGWTEQDFIDHILELRSEIVRLETQKEKQPLNKLLEIEQNRLSEKDFNFKWSYPTKVAFLLTIKNKPLTSEEIHHLLLKLDKSYTAYSNPKGTLSVYLTLAAKRGRIKVIKLAGIKTLYFILPDWLTKDGSLEPTFYNKITHFEISK